MPTARITWDDIGKRYYETGVDRGVLYPQDASGAYPLGVPWNGLTGVTESPSGAESTPIYADNIQYVNLIGAEKFGCTVEAFTYPPEWEECDGNKELAVGVTAGQQTRKGFGLSYRTVLGNDVAGNDLGYKLHIVYGGKAAPSEKAYATVNDSPETVTFSWEVTTTPVPAGSSFKPTAILTIDSTKTTPEKLAKIEDVLYGSATIAAHLPLPAEVLSLLSAG